MKLCSFVCDRFVEKPWSVHTNCTSCLLLHYALSLSSLITKRQELECSRVLQCDAVRLLHCVYVTLCVMHITRGFLIMFSVSYNARFKYTNSCVSECVLFHPSPF